MNLWQSTPMFFSMIKRCGPKPEVADRRDEVCPMVWGTEQPSPRWHLTITLVRPPVAGLGFHHRLRLHRARVETRWTRRNQRAAPRLNRAGGPRLGRAARRQSRRRRRLRSGGPRATGRPGQPPTRGRQRRKPCGISRQHLRGVRPGLGGADGRYPRKTGSCQARAVAAPSHRHRSNAARPTVQPHRRVDAPGTYQ
jgi:hypothetical protein